MNKIVTVALLIRLYFYFHKNAGNCSCNESARRDPIVFADDTNYGFFRSNRLFLPINCFVFILKIIEKIQCSDVLMSWSINNVNNQRINTLLPECNCDSICVHIFKIIKFPLWSLSRSHLGTPTGYGSFFLISLHVYEYWE